MRQMMASQLEEPAWLIDDLLDVSPISRWLISLPPLMHRRDLRQSTGQKRADSYSVGIGEKSISCVSGPEGRHMACWGRQAPES